MSSVVARGVGSIGVTGIFTPPNSIASGVIELVAGSGMTVTQSSGSFTFTRSPLVLSDITLTEHHILVGNVSNVAADVALSGDATIVSSGALTLATVNANVGSFTNANITVNAKGLITAASSGSGATIDGSGVAGRIAEWLDTDTLQASTLIKSGIGILSIDAGTTVTLTAPAVSGAMTLGAGTLTVSTTNDATIASHTHAITSSSNPGANARLLASDASGHLQLVRLGLGMAPSYALDISQTYSTASLIFGQRTTYTTNNANVQTFSGGFYNLYTAGASGSNSQTYGLLAYARYSGASGAASGFIAGGNFNADSSGGAGTVGDMRGGYFRVSCSTSGVTFTNARAGYFEVASVSGSAITNGYGAFIKTPGVVAGTLINSYGVYIEAHAAATTLNYAIYSAGGASYHAGNIGLGNGGTGFTATIQLHDIGVTATDNAPLEVMRLESRVTGAGVGAAGFGTALTWYAESSVNGTYRQQAQLSATWATATDASRKAKAVMSVYDTAERSALTFEADGSAADVYFEGGAGSGLPYGSCYGNDIAWSQASAVQDTWYIVSDTDMTDGHGGLNLVTHDGSGRLTATKAGRYRVTYGATVGCSVANKLIQTTIAVNGTPINDGIQHTIMSVVANIPIASTAIVVLAASGYVEFAIRTTDTGTPDISVEHLNVTIEQVGG